MNPALITAYAERNRLAHSLREIGNIAGGPTMSYSPETERQELLKRLMVITNVVQGALRVPAQDGEEARRIERERVRQAYAPVEVLPTVTDTYGSQYELSVMFLSEGPDSWNRRVRRKELHEVVRDRSSSVGVFSARRFSAYKVVAEVKKFFWFVTNVKIGCKTFVGADARRLYKWANYS